MIYADNGSKGQGILYFFKFTGGICDYASSLRQGAKNIMLRSFIKGNLSLNSPYWLQELAGNSYLCYMNLLDLMNPSTLKLRIFLSASQWFSKAELEKYQTKKLRQLINHIYRNVPYYKEIFDKNNLTPSCFETLKDLKKLPILTREDVIKNSDKLISRLSDKKYMRMVRGSGSTGNPMQFCRDKRDEPIHHAFARRALSSVNVRGIDRKIYIWSRPFVEGGVKEIFIYEPHLKKLILSPFFQSPDRYIEFIRMFKPAVICGSPSHLYHLACYAQEHFISDITFKCAISYFENLFNYQRELIESQFRCKVYSYYVSQERVVSAFECPSQKGMHIDMERGILEIVGENGEAFSQGSSGRIVVTGLHNYLMPFVRYDIGDIGSISEARCACGRGLTLLKSIDGRASEAIKYKGKYINSVTLSALADQFNNIKECQFVQENDDLLKVNIVKRRGFSENDSREIIAHLQSIIGEGLDMEINYVESIPRTKMGKFPFVISKLTSGR